MLFFTALYHTVKSSGWLLNNVTATFPSFEITSKPSLYKRNTFSCAQLSQNEEQFGIEQTKFIVVYTNLNVSSPVLYCDKEAISKGIVISSTTVSLIDDEERLDDVSGDCRGKTNYITSVMVMYYTLILLNSHTALVLDWPGHDSWENSHTNSLMSTLTNSHATLVLVWPCRTWEYRENFDVQTLIYELSFNFCKKLAITLSEDSTSLVVRESCVSSFPKYRNNIKHFTKKLNKWINTGNYNNTILPRTNQQKQLVLNTESLKKDNKMFYIQQTISKMNVRGKYHLTSFSEEIPKSIKSFIVVNVMTTLSPQVGERTTKSPTSENNTPAFRCFTTNVTHSPPFFRASTWKKKFVLY